MDWRARWLFRRPALALVRCRAGTVGTSCSIRVEAPSSSPSSPNLIVDLAFVLAGAVASCAPSVPAAPRPSCAFSSTRFPDACGLEPNASVDDDDDDVGGADADGDDADGDDADGDDAGDDADVCSSSNAPLLRGPSANRLPLLLALSSSTIAAESR